MFQKDCGVKRGRNKKIKTENTEREKLMNAVTLTDIPATVKKRGFIRTVRQNSLLPDFFVEKYSLFLRIKRPFIVPNETFL